LFIDDSSKIIQGKRHTGYSMVDGEILKVIESGRLLNSWLAQTCELFSLSQALMFLMEKESIQILSMHLGFYTPLGWYGQERD
jgi:hypothetical protein